MARMPPSRCASARSCLRTSSKARRALSLRRNQLVIALQNALRRARLKSARADSWTSIEVHLARAVRVDHRRVVIPRRRHGALIVDVGVPVEVITRTEHSKEPAQRAEPLMRLVGPVVDATRRRVRDKDIEEATAADPVEDERWHHPDDREPEVAFAALVRRVAVAGRPAKSSDEKAVDELDPSIEVDRVPPLADPLVVDLIERDVVVPMDGVERRRELRSHKVEIVVREIAAADDQIDIPEPRSRFGCVDRRVDLVAEREDLHRIHTWLPTRRILSVSIWPVRVRRSCGGPKKGDTRCQPRARPPSS